MAGDHVVLSEERRTGKTTVALGAVDELAADDRVVIALDLSERVPDSPALAERIAEQLAQQRSSLATAARAAGRFGLRLWNRSKQTQPLVDSEEVQIFSKIMELLETRQTGAERLSAALDQVAEFAKACDEVAVVFIDEVQELAKWIDTRDVQSDLRARLRDPERVTTFLFAGSEESLLDSLFGKGGLLEQDGLEFSLSPIDYGPWLEGLRKAFRDLAMDVNRGALDVILKASQMRPLETMLAANKTHEAAEWAEERVITEALAAQGVAEARRSRLWTLS